MTRHFRSKSCGFLGLSDFNTAPRNSLFNYNKEDDEEEEEQEFEEEAYEDEIYSNPISTPFISPGSRANGTNQQGRHCHANGQNHQFAIMDILMAALRKSLVTCSVERDDVSSSWNISSPTEVKHVSHVTFDKFNGFMGLPTELEPEVPRKVPSASASVFGVSAKSMQCSYDDKGNSIPTILLMMQNRLYAGGGLQAEGIFRINAENSQEERVRDQLNRGVVPHGIDIHCLAGLIKAWFRELPNGVLDSLTPEQVMHCNTEDDCTKLVKLLPPTEAALLAWAINLMADVVHHEQQNKMNARNIAMVFAPNMTQMADPLTALIHAVQVMNFLKTLILKTLREREEFKAAKAELFSPCSISPILNSGPTSSDLNTCAFGEHDVETLLAKEPSSISSLRTMTLYSLDKEIDEKLWCSEMKNDTEENVESISDINTSGIRCAALRGNECDDGGYEGGDWQRWRKGVRKLCRHPVLQLSRPTKKTGNLGIVNTREGGRETWA